MKLCLLLLLCLGMQCCGQKPDPTIQYHAQDGQLLTKGQVVVTIWNDTFFVAKVSGPEPAINIEDRQFNRKWVNSSRIKSILSEPEIAYEE